MPASGAHLPRDDKQARVAAREAAGRPGRPLPQGGVNSSGPLTHADILRMQQSAGNRVVAGLLAPAKSPPPPSMTFASAGTVYLKSGGPSVQRRIGHHGNVGDWVVATDLPGLDDRKGKIFKVDKENTKVAFSWRHLPARKVKSYLVTMNSAEYDDERSDIKVDPDDSGWELFDKAKVRESKEAEEEEAPEESEGDTGGLLGGSKGSLKARGASSLASAKETASAVKGAGTLVGKSVSGMTAKSRYNETKFDEIAEGVGDVAKWLDRASHLFPPAKIVTTPLAHVVSGANKVRKGVRLAQLAGDEAAVPLVSSNFDEALELLEEHRTKNLRSDDKDEQSRLERTIAALEAAVAKRRKAVEAKGE